MRVWTCAIAAGLDTREEVASIVRALESGAEPLSHVRAVFSRCSVPEDATGQLFAGLTGECRMATEFAHGCTVRLCTLPLRFDTLYSDSVRRKCCVCSTVPESAAICLLCGAFLCAGSSKCKKAMGTGLGPCTTHAKQCGGGVGMFLLVHSSGVRVRRVVVVDMRRVMVAAHTACGWGVLQLVILRDTWAAFYASPYVDHHGEQDLGFRRGLPLTLSEQRYEAMTCMWGQHKVRCALDLSRPCLGVVAGRV